jgi:hypothetical protein
VFFQLPKVSSAVSPSRILQVEPVNKSNFSTAKGRGFTLKSDAKETCRQGDLAKFSKLQPALPFDLIFATYSNLETPKYRRLLGLVYSNMPRRGSPVLTRFGVSLKRTDAVRGQGKDGARFRAADSGSLRFVFDWEVYPRACHHASDQADEHSNDEKPRAHQKQLARFRQSLHKAHRFLLPLLQHAAAWVPTIA